MDIHKPKPWHGVREFLKEYLTIVVGVLTALGAEAVVQNLHEQRLSAEARESVRGELNINITNQARRRLVEPCIAQQIDEIGALLDRADGGGPVPPATNIGGLNMNFVVGTQRWQAATASGRTSLLTSEEQRGFSRVYAWLDQLAANEVDERRAWMHLRALKGLKRLSPEMIYGQRIALSEARDLDSGIQRDFASAKHFATMVGVKGDARLSFAPGAVTAATPAVCPPIGAPTPVTPGEPTQPVRCRSRIPKEYAIIVWWADLAIPGGDGKPDASALGYTDPLRSGPAISTLWPVARGQLLAGHPPARSAVRGGGEAGGPLSFRTSSVKRVRLCAHGERAKQEGLGRAPDAHDPGRTGCERRMRTARRGAVPPLSLAPHPPKGRKPMKVNHNFSCHGGLRQDVRIPHVRTSQAVPPREDHSLFP